MKKFLLLFMVFILLCSVAYADTFTEFFANWNKNAHIYGTPELTEDMVTSDGETYTIHGDNWTVIVVVSSNVISHAEVHASDGDTLLPLCVTTGVNAVRYKTADTLSQFLGNLLTMYLRAISDQSPRSSAFDTYQYSLEKTDEGFIFSMDDIY